MKQTMVIGGCTDEVEATCTCMEHSDVSVIGGSPAFIFIALSIFGNPVTPLFVAWQVLSVKGA